MVATPKQRTVRVTEATHQILRELRARSGESMTTIIERAVERYQRERLLAEANAAWLALWTDPAAMAEIEAEQAAWDQTLADGLEGAEW